MDVEARTKQRVLTGADYIDQPKRQDLNIPMLEAGVRRQTRAEVEKLLVDTKLVEQMKAFSQWDDWVNGRRGVSK